MHNVPPGARHFPATARNRDAICEVLSRHLPDTGLAVEIASGSGEHILCFAERFAKLDWLPSDPDPLNLASIRAWADTASPPLQNLRAPVAINASDVILPIEASDAVLCINMIHIAPWDATEGLMRNAAVLLPPGGPLYLYGPYFRDGVPTAPSNEAFDRQLRAENETWGIRNLSDVTAEAAKNGLDLVETVEMPSNNLSVVFRKTA